MQKRPTGQWSACHYPEPEEKAMPPWTRLTALCFYLSSILPAPEAKPHASPKMYHPSPCTTQRRGPKLEHQSGLTGMSIKGTQTHLGPLDHVLLLPQRYLLFSHARAERAWPLPP